MKSKIYTGMLATALLGLASCSDYLDMTPTDEVSDKTVWSSVASAEYAVNYFYHITDYFSPYYDDTDGGQCTAGMTEGLTDMIKYSDTNYSKNHYIPSEMSYGEDAVLTANYVAVYLGNWSEVYDYVRRVNEALSNLYEYGEFDQADKTRLEAELRFFRGMLYFDLVKRYKEVIIYDRDLSQIQPNKALSSEAAGWQFVYDDLSFAGANLAVSATSNGRVTSGAAYALLARAMLYAERWTDARDAAKKVIDMHLYDLAPTYAEAFKSNGIEAIWEYDYNANGMSHTWDNLYAPGGDMVNDGNAQSGGLANPTQEMVESFELATGGFPDWTPWHSTTGTDAEPPYAQLEPRFAASVLYNGSAWKGRTIEPFVGGTDGWCKWYNEPSNNGRTVTGYFLKKLVDENHHFSAVQAGTTPWIDMRYAELLLNYAEACYHTGDDSEANWAVEKVRDRVGLPYTAQSGDNLMAAIRQERKVELMCEGYYYWDMRRWGLSHTAFTGVRRHGLKIEKQANGSFVYTYVEVDHKDMNFPQKMYQCPLPSAEIDGNQLVDQYPEWQ